MKTTVLVTGGFDPVHAGHIAYFDAAAAYGDRVVVGLNSDAWLTRKKGRPFMNFGDRHAVLRALRNIDQVISFDDDDGTACNAIEKVLKMYPGDRLVFANGGDRTRENVPEMRITHPDLQFLFGFGGEIKQNSSSDLLSRWKTDRTTREWGVFDVLREYPGCKVKELIVKPGKSTSLQRHFKRAELWFVRSGEGVAVCGDFRLKLARGSYLGVNTGEWHQIQNTGEDLLCIIEVQFGAECVEDDIERRAS